MIRLCLIIISSIVLFLGACKKSDYTPQPGLLTPVALLSAKGAGVATPLTGKWQWVKSYHSNTGTLTPALANYTERLEFSTDSIMTIYRNDTYYYRFAYLYVSEYKYGGLTFPVSLINGYTYQTVIKNDTLNFSTFDLPEQNQLIYVKIK